MNERMQPSYGIHLALSCLFAAVLGACVSSTPAPVESRDVSRSKATATSSSSSASSASSSGAPAVARPGYYIVKKGDTLYSIALENGHSYRDLAGWNNIDNPAMIAVGQELRVQPPDAAITSPAGTRPVSLPRLETRPIDQSAPVAAQSSSSSMSSSVALPQAMPVNAGGMLTEPRGGRLPYSEKGWKDLQAMQSTPAASPSAVPTVVPKPPLPASAPVASASASSSTSTPVSVVPDPAARIGEEGLEWSWPSNGKVVASFNDSSNKGLDIGGAIGDPVFAAASGKIIYAGSALRGYGNLVIIQHAAQYTSVYAHNREILVKEGQLVQKGQKIAVMGDSDSDKPKLHFEVRKQGKPADPLKFLPTR